MDASRARTLISGLARSRRMRVPALATLALLLLAGCVSPGAQVQPASLAALDALDIGGASRTVLPDGDVVFALAGSVADVEEFEFVMPEGVGVFEYTLPESGAGYSVAVVDKESGMGMCRVTRYQAWYVPVDGPLVCRGVAGVNAGATWLVRVRNTLPADVITGAREAAEFAVDLKLSPQPLDGAAARLDLTQLSRPVFEVMEPEHHKVASSVDGALLHVEVMRPQTDEPVPVLLVASPYNTPDRAVNGVAKLPLMKYFAPRGYALAVMDLRGTGISGGCFSVRAAIDQDDIKDVVDWLGSQEWSSGKVGMMGVSYEGFTPVAAAVAQPKHLTAIFAGAPAVDMYANYVPGGVNTGRTLSTAIVGYAALHAADTTEDPSNPLGPVEYRVDAFCDPAALTVGNDPRDVYSDYFAERNLTELVERIQVPVYLEQGFWDNNVKANFVPEFFNALQVPKRGVFGSYEHAYTPRADQWLMLQAWFDHWLLERDTRIMDAPSMEVLTNTRQYRAGDAWPPLDAALVDVPLAEGSYLAAPTRAPVSPMAPVLETVSEPFADGLYVSGVPALAFSASLARGGNTYFYAEIHEEKANGDRQIVIMGWLNAAHRDGHRVYAPLLPGETRDFEMQFLPIDHVVQPGSRLVVVLGSTHDGASYGGPEGGLTEPGVVDVGAGVLQLPTLPMDTISPAPRSAT